MSSPVVRPAAIYWKNKRYIEANKASVKFTSGSKEIFGANGLACFSRGAKVVELTISEYTPVSGSTSTKNLDAFIAQTDIELTVLIGGEAITFLVWNTERGYESDSESGTLEGSVTFKGKILNVTG